MWQIIRATTCSRPQRLLVAGSIPGVSSSSKRAIRRNMASCATPASALSRTLMEAHRTKNGGRCFVKIKRTRISSYPSQQAFSTRTTFSRSIVSSNEDDADNDWYKSRIEAGELCHDKSQEVVARRLQKLQTVLQKYSNERPVRDYYRRYHQEQQLQQQQQKLLLRKDNPKVKEPHNKPLSVKQIQQPLSPPPKIPKGLYLFGGVGTGKSMLMDAFYENVQIPDTSNNNNQKKNRRIKKRRFHFHEFLAEIHKRIHIEKLKYDAEKKEKEERRMMMIEAAITVDDADDRDDKDDGAASITTTDAHQQQVNNNNNPVIAAVAIKMAKEYSLLCLDEFQVTDIADYVILSQLLDVLFAHGVVFVMTSNLHVNKIFATEGQFYRHDDIVPPLTDSIQRYCNVISIDSETDYRQEVLLELSENNGQHHVDFRKVVDGAHQMKEESEITTIVENYGGVVDEESTVPDSTHDNVLHNDDADLSTNKDNVLASSGKEDKSLIQDDNDDESSLEIMYKKGQASFRKAMYLVHGRDKDIKEQINDILFDVLPSETDINLNRVELNVGWGRTVTVRSYTKTSSSTTAPSVARFDFDELCGGFGSGYTDLGASDYRAIAREFDICILENIPILSDSSKQRSTGHNQARRFITLIDELYEAKTALLCSAAAPPSELFVTTTTIPDESARTNDNDSSGELLAIDQATDSGGHAVGALASVKELRFAFKRAASRLVQMTSSKWWQMKDHREAQS